MTPTGQIPPDLAPYTFDNSTQDAATQVQMLAGILDRDSTAVLDTIGIEAGWRCLDIGPGAGTITGWLADQVGDTGMVTALDIDPRHVKGADNIQIQTGDIRTTPLPTDHFDLIHARLVLMHLPTRQQVLNRLVTALRPGGVIVLSEWECTDPEGMVLHLPTQEATDAFVAFQRAMIDLIVANGAGEGWARQVPLAMRVAGLTGIRAIVMNHLWYGGEPGCLLHESNSRQLAGALMAAGVSADQLAVLRSAMVSPETMTYQYTLVSSIGRRPA